MSPIANTPGTLVFTIPLHDGMGGPCPSCLIATAIHTIVQSPPPSLCARIARANAIPVQPVDQSALVPGFRVILPESLDWQPFTAFPTATRLAVLIGNPDQPGPYVIRIRVPAGQRVNPLRHFGDRVYTVISGVFYIGLGESFDENKLTAHGPASVVAVPSGQAHFHWAKSGGYIVQVNGIGPVNIEYLNRGDDPRHR